VSTNPDSPSSSASSSSSSRSPPTHRVALAVPPVLYFNARPLTWAQRKNTKINRVKLSVASHHHSSRFWWDPPPPTHTQTPTGFPPSYVSGAERPRGRTAGGLSSPRLLDKLSEAAGSHSRSPPGLPESSHDILDELSQLLPIFKWTSERGQTHTHTHTHARTHTRMKLWNTTCRTQQTRHQHIF